MRIIKALVFLWMFSFSLVAQTPFCNPPDEIVNNVNLLPNGGFENVYSDDNDNFRPHCFLFRKKASDPDICNLHGIGNAMTENLPSPFEGRCIKFNNPTSNSKSGYFYGFHGITNTPVTNVIDLSSWKIYTKYDEDPCDISFEKNFLPVNAGSEFEFSFNYKTESTCQVFAQIQFAKGNKVIGNVQTEYTISADPHEDRMVLKTLIPSTITHISVGIYYKGTGKAWVDNAELIRTQVAFANNLSFEKDMAAPTGIPDFFAPNENAIACHGHETNSAMCYIGCGAAKFNPTDESTPCSYTLGREIDGTGAAIEVEGGTKYTINGFCRSMTTSNSEDFTLAVIFTDDNETQTAVSEIKAISNTSWQEMKLEFIVPEWATWMTPKIVYTGIGIAWFDHIGIDLGHAVDPTTCPRPAPLDKLEELPALPNPEGRVSRDNMIAKFNKYHTHMEEDYEGAGVWNFIKEGMPEHSTLQCVVAGEEEARPLIRMVANAAIGYLNAYCVIPNCVFIDRAREALDHLIAEQNDLGTGGFRWYKTCAGESSRNATLYEGSIACMALLKAYEVLGDPVYLNAAEDYCEHLLTVPPNANANYTAFGLWALSEYLKVVDPSEAEAYYNKAMEYFDALVMFQLNSGMWLDEHNQEIHYHGIITRGLVNFLSVMDVNEPKYQVVNYSVYRAINHIIRNQKDFGEVITTPCDEDDTRLTGFPIDANVMANEYLAFSVADQKRLKRSIDLFTHGAANFDYEAQQGHQFATLGLLLSHYYKNESGTCNVINCPEGNMETRIKKDSFSVWPNPAKNSLHIRGAGKFQIYNTAGQLVLANLSAGTINVEELKPGIYFVKNGKETKRIVIFR